jgi:hypothetical protein
MSALSLNKIRCDVREDLAEYLDPAVALDERTPDEVHILGAG